MFSFKFQLVKIAKKANAAHDISLLSWIFFTFNAFIGFSYAVFVIEDTFLNVTSSITLVVNIIAVTMITYKRKKYKEIESV
jgi:lipid-A-disaccharide synthase-like uncharacterized protein